VLPGHVVAPSLSRIAEQFKLHITVKQRDREHMCTVCSTVVVQRVLAVLAVPAAGLGQPKSFLNSHVYANGSGVHTCLAVQHIWVLRRG
jgi:hypothetical protein